MIFIIIGVLAGIILSAHITNNYDPIIKRIVISILHSLWIVPIGASIGLFLMFFIGLFINPTTKEEIIDTKPIYSFVDNINISGHFFLGCGTVKGEIQYYYIIKKDKGNIIKTIDTKNTYIKEGNPPSISTVERMCKSKWIYWFAMPTYDTQYIITVPEGSIKYNYEVDLK